MKNDKNRTKRNSLVKTLQIESCFALFYDVTFVYIAVLFVVYDLSEVRLQGRAAYQAAVDVGLSEKLGSRSRVHGSAVLNADGFCSRFIVDLADACTDCRTYFLRLLCGSGLAGTDCPDGLVSDDSGLRLISRYVQESDLDLLTDPVDGDSLLSLSEVLFTVSSVSAKYSLLSECPMITYFTPASVSMSGAISPV